MKKIYTFTIALFLLSTSLPKAQTVVKMDMPEQAEFPLEVVALFDEEIPEGIPVVLGLMGYDITGGMEPYQFEWMLNDEVISTTDMAVFTPQQGDDLALRITDNNICSTSTAFNLKISSLPHHGNDSDNFIRIFPTLVKSEIQIEFTGSPHPNALLRIFNMGGKKVWEQHLGGNTRLFPALNPGTYFVSVRSGNRNKVEKIIVL
jgi:hypothetical protein